MLGDTLRILDQGFYTLGGKRIPLMLTPAQMREISVYLHKIRKSAGTDQSDT